MHEFLMHDNILFTLLFIFKENSHHVNTQSKLPENTIELKFYISMATTLIGRNSSKLRPLLWMNGPIIHHILP